MVRNQNKIWSEKAKLLAKELHNEIGLDNYNTHQYRGNKKRRSAELISAALADAPNSKFPCVNLSRSLLSLKKIILIFCVLLSGAPAKI